jgi:hypothetical protein
VATSKFGQVGVLVVLVTGLVGCVTTSKPVENSIQPPAIVPNPEVKPKKTPKYSVGDCLMIVDLPNGKVESPYRVRIEKIEANFYWYRWLLDNNEWAIDLSCLKQGAGPCWDFEALEKISKKVSDCPNGG